MALIPPDAGVRLRMQTEASLLQPLGPVKEIPGDLPELQPGQAFTARIQEALPENTYKALVAGRLLTLQLPEGAKAGDTLELVVIDRSAKVVIAERSPSPPAAPATTAYPYANLSRTGQLIAQLLLPEGESPTPAPLNRGQPMLTQPPESAAELVPVLAKAISTSGLFYEAHQAQWVNGRLPLESLRAEPQGRQPTGESPLPAGTTEPARIAGEESRAPAPGQALPEELRPLVQQQLDAVATQRLAWHGEVWPGQSMNWQIEREVIDERSSAGTDEAPAERWTTRLRLTMPRLGTVDAVLQLAGQGLRLRLDTGEATATELGESSAALIQAMTAAGLPVLGLEIRHGDE